MESKNSNEKDTDRRNIMMHLTETVHASDKISSEFCYVGYQYLLAGTTQFPIVLPFSVMWSHQDMFTWVRDGQPSATALSERSVMAEQEPRSRRCSLGQWRLSDWQVLQEDKSGMHSFSVFRYHGCLQKSASVSPTKSNLKHHDHPKIKSSFIS